MTDCCTNPTCPHRLALLDVRATLARLSNRTDPDAHDEIEATCE